MKCCKVPFETLYLHRGWASTCCPNWYSAYRKKTNFSQSPQQLWENAIFDAHRYEVSRNDYSQCSRCPLVNADGMKTVIRSGWRNGPREVHIADSFVCNLHCWSCRGGKHLSDGEDGPADQFLWRFLEHFRQTIKDVTLLNSGEVFASERHVRLLNEFDWGDINLGIITNATLIDRKWTTVQKIHERVKRFVVSLDASNEETYNQVRLGGSWKAAVRGMELIKSTGRPIKLHYVVSDKNVHDLPVFAEWAQQWEPERIEFIPLARTYERDDWDERDVFRVDHPLNSVLRSNIETAAKHRNVHILDGS